MRSIAGKIESTLLESSETDGVTLESICVMSELHSESFDEMERCESMMPEKIDLRELICSKRCASSPLSLSE